jgi:uncharacterized coiled-coil DUF342 family protein
MCVLNADLDAAEARVEQLKQALEQAIAERTPHDYGILKEEAQEMRKQRDEARAELQLLKQERDLWQQIQRDKATVNQSLTVRPEPSRLEIAAMTLAARSTSTFFRELNSEAQHALAAADALIAAAKEGK